MTRGTFIDRSHPPSVEEIRSALGSKYPLWERLTQFIDTHYRIAGELSFWGPAQSGWNLRYRVKGRSLVALYPQQERIVAQVVLGKAQAEQALRLELGEKASKMLREAPQLHDGRWLWIPVLDGADAEDVEQLLQVKMRPLKGTQ